MMMKVSIDDLKLAANWLGYNEGEDGERATCLKVADWLDAEIKKRELSALYRNTAKYHHLTPKQARDVVKKAELMAKSNG